MTEQQIQDKILVEFNKTYHKHLRLWRNNVGLAYGYGRIKQLMGYLAQGKFKKALSYCKTIRPVNFGVKGSPDLQGFIKIDGKAVYLGIEVKREDGSQSDIQIKYAEMIEAYGGYYFVCRSLTEAVSYIESVLKYDTKGKG